MFMGDVVTTRQRKGESVGAKRKANVGGAGARTPQHAGEPRVGEPRTQPYRSGPFLHSFILYNSACVFQ